MAEGKNQVNEKWVKAIALVSLCMCCFGTTAILYLMGTCIYDILLHNNTPVTEEWIIFLSQGIGVASSNLLVLLMIRYLNQYLFESMGSLLLVSCIATVVCAVSNYFILTNIFFAIGGLVTGGAEMLGTIVAVHIWQEKSPPILQTITAATGFANVIGPVIIAPFLYPKAAGLLGNLTLCLTNQTASETMNCKYFVNQTQEYRAEYVYPFSFFSLALLIGTIGFLIIVIYERIKHRHTIVASLTELSQSLHLVDTSKPRMTISTLIPAAVILFFIGGIQNIQSNLLTTYIVTYNEILTSENAAHILSVVQALFVSARLLSIPLSIKFGSSLPLGIGIALFSIGGVLLIFDPENVPILWTSFLLQGFGSGPILPALIGWCPENYSITQITQTLSMTGIFIGHLALGTLVAKLMDIFGRLAFVISVNCIAIVMVVNYIILVIKLTRDKKRAGYQAIN